MKVKVHKKSFNKQDLIYPAMELIYYEILDQNFCNDSFDGKLDLQVCGLIDEEVIVINLNNVTLDVFPAILIKENKKAVRHACLRAAIFCFVAGDRVADPENNYFRANGSLFDLADYLYETVCKRAKKMRGI